MKNKHKGFTLVEIIVTILIMSLVIAVAANILTATLRGNSIANNEFNLQSNMRNVSETLNQSIKFSPAVFTLKKATFEATKKPGWSYFGIEDIKNGSGVSTGKHQIVRYIPIEVEEIVDGETVITYKTEEPTHERKLLLDEPDDMDFNLYFTKDISASKGKLLEFVIEGISNDSLQRKMTVKTQLQALNAMVVEHAGNPAVAIAYKEEDPGKRIKGTQDAYAVITLVLDKSGSMRTNMNGKSRISILNERTNKLINDLKTVGDKVYISIIPYDTRVDGYKDALPNFKKAKQVPAVNLGYGGSTNTGEALLKSYEMLKNKPGITIPTGAKVNYYNIVLTDGNPEEYTRYILDGNKTSPDSGYPIQDMNNRYYFEDVYGGFWGNSYRYTDHYFYRDAWTSTVYTNSHDYDTVSNSSYNMKYVKRIAKDLISTSSLEIKSYIIGFGGGNDALSKEIASYCVGHDSKIENPLNADGIKAYYSATSSDELDIVYSELTEIIKGDMWHVMGPY